MTDQISFVQNKEKGDHISAPNLYNNYYYKGVSFLH